MTAVAEQGPAGAAGSEGLRQGWEGIGAAVRGALTRCSQQTDKLAAALSKAQLAMSPAAKDRTANAGSYSYRYATLASCWEAIRKPLGENGLAVVQRVTVGEGERFSWLTVETILMHTSGQWISDAGIKLPAANQPQQLGIAISYAKRYGLSAVVGLATDDDEDGHVSGGSSAPPSSAPAKRQGRKAAASSGPPESPPPAEPRPAGQEVAPPAAGDDAAATFERYAEQLRHASDEDRVRILNSAPGSMRLRLAKVKREGA